MFFVNKGGGGVKAANLVTGFRPLASQFLEDWVKRWEELGKNHPAVREQEMKVFKPKHPLPHLMNYREPAPDWYWLEFPSNLVQPAKPSIDWKRLKKLGEESGFKDVQLLGKIIADVREGARIGCTGEARAPSRSTNAPSAFEDGEKVSDALADWVKKKFAFGPIHPSEVPAEAKFSGIMTRQKPNGSVRVILNLSASSDGTPVNKGIEKKDFPTSMSTLEDWLRAMKDAGKGCKFCKIDWSDAYKHLTVHQEDTDLQWFMWLGMAFKELCLIFGCTSSAGLFDRLAKLVLHIVVVKSGIDRRQVIQFLDDCCAAAQKDSPVLDRFDKTFFEVAKELGIKLAPRSDPDKSFSPSTRGTVLGITYDSVAWTWALPNNKLEQTLRDIDSLLSSSVTTQERIWSTVGRILYIMPLVPTGKFNVDHLLRINSVSEDRNCVIELPEKVKRQLRFWREILPVCSGVTSIPDPDNSLPPWAIEFYTDAAGGTLQKAGHGVGSVTVGCWVFLPWSKAINAGRQVADDTERKLDRILSALELMGPLLTLTAGMGRFRGKMLKFWIDNSGSVYIYKKGYSTSCSLCSTIVKATATLAATFGCRVEVDKIARCSSPMAVMADCLSKADFEKFWNVARGNGGFELALEPARVPGALLQWLEDPREDDDLGDKLVRGILAANPSWASPALF